MGLQLEEHVRRYFESQGFRFYAQRLETPFAEVDLVFLKNSRIYFIEVKSSRADYDLSQRIKPQQTMRLRRATEWWAAKIGKEPCLLFAFVDTVTHKITLIEPNYF